MGRRWWSAAATAAAVLCTAVAVHGSAGGAASGATTAAPARAAGHGVAAAAAQTSATYPPLAGVGAGTTQAFMNAVAGVAKDAQGKPIFASVAANGDPQVAVKDPAVSPACTISRPSESRWGVAALERSQATAEGCVQFARATVVSTGDAYAPSTDITFVPFADDVVTYAIAAGSNLPRQLTTAQLAQIYTCQAAGVTPLLPQWGSGTRTVFLQQLGLTDAIDFTQQHPCVSEATGQGKAVTETDLRGLTDPNMLIPVSAADYLAQYYLVTPDEREGAVLGSVDQTQPIRAAYATSYAVAENSNIPRSASAADLASLYTCQAGPGYQPLLPPFGDPTRAAFLQAIGLTDSATFTTAHPCVTQVGAANDGRQISNAAQIMPYSVSAYVNQIAQNIPDISGNAVIGQMNGAPAVVLNTAAPMTHAVYNAVPTASLTTAPYQGLFVGSSSTVCAQHALIAQYGFAALATCGDTSTKVGP